MHCTVREPLFLPYRSDEQRSALRSIPQACSIEVLEEEPLEVMTYRNQAGLVSLLLKPEAPLRAVVLESRLLGYPRFITQWPCEWVTA